MFYIILPRIVGIAPRLLLRLRSLGVPAVVMPSDQLHILLPLLGADAHSGALEAQVPGFAGTPARRDGDGAPVLGAVPGEATVLRLDQVVFSHVGQAQADAVVRFGGAWKCLIIISCHLHKP